MHGADWKDDVRYGMIFSAPDIEGEDGKDLHEWLTIVQRKKEVRNAPAEQLNDQELLPPPPATPFIAATNDLPLGLRVRPRVAR